MKTTINLVDSLLVKGRNLHRLGVQDKAQQILDSLSSFRDLPNRIACETRLRLAQIHGKRRKFRRARRLLATVIAQHPHTPRHHHQMGRLAEADFRCQPDQAEKHYEQSIKLDPRNARYISSLAMFAFRNQSHRKALGLLRRAHRRSPLDPIVLRRYVKVLIQMQRLREARHVLRNSRFRLNKSPWFQKLYQEFRHHAVHLRQQKRREVPLQPVKEESLCLLPFLATVRDNPPTDQEHRVDGPSVLPAPHLRLRFRKSDQRHAQ